MSYMEVLNAIRAFETVDEETAKKANCAEIWKDYHDPQLIMRKYGAKPPGVSMEEYVKALKQRTIEAKDNRDSVHVHNDFEENERREFFSMFTPEEFSDLVMHTYTPRTGTGNYCLAAYPGLTFSGMRGIGVYVCVGYEKPDVTRLPKATLIEDGGEDEGINFVHFEDDVLGIKYYHHVNVHPDHINDFVVTSEEK